MTALEEGLAELARADWPWRIVEACMFVHARGDHVGWTYGGDGRARCGLDGCGWGISARSDDPAIERARFAIAALGVIGLVFAMVVDVGEPIYEFGMPHPVRFVRIGKLPALEAFDTSDVEEGR